MVFWLMVTLSEEESVEARLAVPLASKPESVQADMWAVLQVTVVWVPLSTRLGLAVRLLMTPCSTQVEPLCSWPLAQVHEGAYELASPFEQVTGGEVTHSDPLCT